jgi:hypothetical protein
MPVQSVARSVRVPLMRFLAVATAVAVLVVVTASSALAAETRTFTGTKDCNVTPSPPDPGGFCVITKSNLEILVNAKIYYTNPDPVALAAGILSSPVTLRAMDEETSTATGHCTFYINTVLGLCVYTSGTGDLQGFHSTMAVAGVKPDTNVYSLTGTYLFDREVVTNTFTGQKECVPPASLITPPALGGYCVLTQSNLAILVNGKAYYIAAVLIPNAGPGGATALDSPIKLKAADARKSTATGHCTYYRPTPTTSGHGLCVYTKGNGALAGFHATLMVGPPIKPGVFSVAGTYWFDREHEGDEDHAGD